MWMLALAATAATVDPTALAAVQACRTAAVASGKSCDGQWRGVRLRLDAKLHGTVRASDDGRSASLTIDCPYDVVHRSGGCALVSRGVIVILPYDREMPALVWGDRNAERRERMITFDGGRTATWGDTMSPADAREVLDLLARSRKATFAWRAARAKVLSTTTLDLVGFGDLTALLAALTRASADSHAAG